MTAEPFPGIVFEICLPFSSVAKLLTEASKSTGILRIEQHQSGSTWKIYRPDKTGIHEIKCELFVAARADKCDMYFSADSERDADLLHESVGICLAIVFHGCEVLSPNMKALKDIPGYPDATAARIATLLQSHKPMTITEIGKTLSILEYTAAPNILKLLKQGVIGCTPPDVIPRKYFYR